MSALGSARRWWPVVSLLGHPGADPAELRALLARQVRGGQDAAVVTRYLDLSKVLAQARHNLDRAGAATLPVEQLGVLVSEQAHRRQVKQQARAAHARRVVQAATDGGAAIIKGLALATYYPQPQLRHRGDVDVMCESLTAAMALVDRLRAESSGWVFDHREPPWLKWADEQPYGQFKLRHELDGTSLRVDIHFGGFSVGHAGLLPVSAAATAGIDGVDALVPDAETSLAILAAHAAGDGYTSLKDLNDIAALAAAVTIDWDRVRAACRSVGVGSVLAGLVEQTRRRHGDAGLPPPSGPARTLPLLDVAPTRRALLVARIAYAEAATRAGRWHAARTALRGLRYYTADLTPRPARRAALAPLVRDREHCWRLLPQVVWQPLAGAARPTVTVEASEPFTGGLTLLRSGPAWVLERGGEVLVPTVSGRLDGRTLSLAAAANGR